MARRPDNHDSKATDPALLQRHSEVKPFQLESGRRFTYPGIRVFYRKHPQAEQLPFPLPLLVFVHGLGGSVAQFFPLLTSLTNVSTCLAIDLPGCGVSDFSPKSWDAYSTDALVELLEIIIDSYRAREQNQGVVLIGHSMGCSLAARLAHKGSAHATDLADHVLGLIAICPPSQPPTEKQVALFRKLLWIPGWIFNLWRAWDRRGGPESASVRRFVGPDADLEAKRMQDRFNDQSKTPVWRRMAWGSLPTYKDGVPHGGIPGKEVWAELDLPLFLIAGESDHIVPAKEVGRILGFLEEAQQKATESDSSSSPERQALVDSAAPVDSTKIADVGSHRPEGIEDISEQDFHRDRRLANPEESYEDPSTPQEATEEIPRLPSHPTRLVKSTILPAPANHALLYMPSTARILAALISDFLASNITGRLSLGWQLQYLSREGKWDVKNLAKWKKVTPVSEPIGGVFRAMKTLREVDETHTPREFVKQWGGIIKDVIDISHDNPVYDPRGLERGGIKYHKFPTVSKIPPTDAEVDAFVTLVDRVRADQKKRAAEEGSGWGDDVVVGVHCHYGFNRTGYFIVCYLLERCGFDTVRKAIDEFATKRPNGIRHSHFIDRLYVRYSGLKQDD